MDINEILKAIEDNKSNKDLLDGLKKFVPEQVKTVEKEKELTSEVVENYINANQSLHDKLLNNFNKKFLTKKLGREATDQDLGAEFVIKTDFDNMQKGLQDNIKDIALQNALGDKYELLKPHINKENIKFENNSVVGVEEAVNALKEKFTSVFGQPEVAETKPKGKGTGLQDQTQVQKKWDEMSVSEKCQMYRENPELAKTLQNK